MLNNEILLSDLYREPDVALPQVKVNDTNYRTMTNQSRIVRIILIVQRRQADVSYVSVASSVVA
jgi:hypothetical protein